MVYPHVLKSRQEAAHLFDTELRNAGWAPGLRLPRFSAIKFARNLVWSNTTTLSIMSGKAKALRRWLQLFRQMCLDEPIRSGCSIHLKNGSSRPPVQYVRRQRRLGLQGTQPIRCARVRDALYQWFVSIRYSADWKACGAKARSSGQPKCLARFTRGLLRQKLKQLMTDYCSQCLVRGKTATTFQPTARWFSGWQREYGLSMRKPNRKCKVPKALMAARLEVGWLNVARVRALCLAVHGYDPERAFGIRALFTTTRVDRIT